MWPRQHMVSTTTLRRITTNFRRIQQKEQPKPHNMHYYYPFWQVQLLPKPPLSYSKTYCTGGASFLRTRLAIISASHTSCPSTVAVPHILHMLRFMLIRSSLKCI